MTHSGIHWLCMTIWVIKQTTDFCPTLWEERMYNSIIGLIYCFDFFNLRDGRSRYRFLAFYSTTIAQNFMCLATYIIFFKSAIEIDLIVTSILVIMGSVVGLSGMLLYYVKFHSVESKESKDDKVCDTSSRTIDRSVKFGSLKQYWRDSFRSVQRTVDQSSHSSTLPEEVTADKKSLLTNIVQNNESVEEGIVNPNCTAPFDEIESVVKVETEVDKHTCSSKVNSTFVKSCTSLTSEHSEECITYEDMEISRKQKRRGICSPTELGLNIDEVESEDLQSSLSSQKRRGICSSTQLGLELVTDEDNYVDKSFVADKIKSDTAPGTDADFHVDKSTACVLNIPSGNIGEIPDSIKDRKRLSTPESSECDSNAGSEKSMQKEETMSHVTSVHDYENVCPLGIARPPWCIRSWRGYMDIETYIHDDSVVRDRRRDTLTSTATGTTFGSEFSESSSRTTLKRTRQEDYMDTLIYDLADWESNAALNEDSAVVPAIEEQEANLFVAKPVVIDEKGGMFALDTILEEDANPLDLDSRRLKASASTLVATIDEIGRCLADNSPQHVYHRSERQWEDLDDPKLMLKKAQLAKVLFASECSERDHYIESFNQAQSSIAKRNKEIEAIKEVARSIGKTPLISAILSDSPILGPRAKIPKYIDLPEEKCNIRNENDNNEYVEMRSLVPFLPDTCKRIHDNDTHFVFKQRDSKGCEVPKSSITSLSGVYESNVQNSMLLQVKSEQKSDHKTILSHEDVKKFNIYQQISNQEKRKTANRPRRKFSLLRERFEPKSERLVYLVSPRKSNPPKSNTMDKRLSILFNDFGSTISNITNNKENLMPSVAANVKQWNDFTTEQNQANAKCDKGAK